MKKITLSLLTLICTGIALPAAAGELMVASAMQRCTTNEDCTLVTNSCNDNCGFVPVNKQNLPTLQNLYQTRCGKAMDANPVCNMNPPISAACINARCTIDYAYQNNASAGDYQSGAYAVPEAPVPSKVPAAPYKNIDDRHGFTAYDLPQNDVREGTVGTLNTTVYVPPSAPVSGGNYMPVDSGTQPMAPAAPAAPVPAAIPPEAVPTYNSYATPSEPVPAAMPAPAVPAPPVYEPAPAPAVPATPAMVAPVPMTDSVPSMTPSQPNLPPPDAPEAVAPQPYQYVAPENVVTAPQPPAPAPVPVAPPGSQPIPPSDLKPAPTFVPPPGGTIPVNPEDPGAPPPEGSSVMLKDGKLGITTMKQSSGDAKNFSANTPSASKSKKLGSFN